MKLHELQFTADDERVSQEDLNELEKYLDALYANDNIDFEFTRHFLDRINDARNRRQITTKELFVMFGKAEKRYGDKIARLGDKAEAVISDLNSQLNSPFVLNFDRRRGIIKLVAKTVMRKKNFRTSNTKLKVW